MTPRTLLDLPTPSLVLDRAKLARNIARMAAACRRNGVALRPHLKTAKSIDVARLVLDAGTVGIAVSTLREAEYFAAEGVRDIQYAVCITPDKLERVARIQAMGVKLALITDNVDVAHAIAARHGEIDATFHVQIEVDCGENRTGVPAGSDDLKAIASALDAAPNVIFDGVMTHAGHSYACRSLAEIEELAEIERRSVVEAAEAVRALGIDCPNVSLGSTPTALHARNLDGVTETRAGVYMFGDMFQAQIGSCRVEDLAVSVLAEVSSHRADLNHLTVDAGALALSKDRGTENVPNDIGFGLIANVAGEALDPQLKVTRVFQEHGLVPMVPGHSLDHFPIGEKVRIFPNHVCMTAAMYDRYHVVDSENGDGIEIVAVWHRVNGW
ncbi:alanine racemase [Sinisalibacter lacisalsi]|uniref:Alanine racemase n=1 Tax=Sinisalibacter lacisalsi TaxID=1526570 RepID=A0ABQ1QR37_9RHOB|nr:alanine racemase [Sinisalibacter lacisalsi]GGD39242.1 alanine racemase [Sinisalibacter lacisalsi]